MGNYNQSYAPGAKLTSTANQVIDFALQGKNTKVDFLSFETFGSDVHIKFNGEDQIHWIPANSERVFSNFNIDKFTVIDNGVEFYYTGFSE